MDDKALKDLLSKYRQGTCTEEELALLENWVSVTTYSEYVISEKELQEDFDLVAKALSLVKPKVTKLWPRIAVAAAAVAAITLGTWLYYTPRHPEGSTATRELLVNDIAPGKNTATLTLADGKVINLDTNRTSVVVADSVKAMTMLTATTPRGGMYQVVLPDGTRVWLNADSKIEFPSQFIGAQRKIILSGEAYFEVTKNKAKPFIVESRGQEVTVLGTHFNINSYADEGSTKTTLLEGSVSVSSLLTSSSLRGRTEESRGNLPGRGPSTTQRAATILKPNQQSILTDSRIKVETVDPADALAWKSGLFVFNNEELESVMRKIARWYNVDVQYAKGANTSEVFAGSINRFENVSKILEMLEKAGDVKFKIEGRKIIVQ